ncbi:gon7 family domain-containing protein [Purpureocillium lilacinum]|uniref:EKC/KEOPS complex subunit GON7 n=2 Tax=Purpureocillium lilacinum TaxID=33203 RepID=A0A179HMU9_PURLI|nr:gon7 family domain-containing protein [Purpureocillium lilacinum]KAK4085792.1 hypothetical protein Purlil1_9952 [Purpureocillium lilacinum]OAQ90780.1 gon7 family domain-containing protein [Purpureocillium lilacinum]GJN78001.1 hypothetical protein PLIIFM63780_001494 [Purpureocillium lilacinum]
MAQPSNNNDTTSSLTATYTSPTNAPFAITKTIPAPTTTSSSSAAAADKSRYLEALRGAVAETQDQVNRELTARMDEDKARDGTASAAAVDEAKEEENYGEDVQEED